MRKPVSQRKPDHFYQAESMQDLFAIREPAKNIATLDRSFLRDWGEELASVAWPAALTLDGKFDLHDVQASLADMQTRLASRLPFMPDHLKEALVADVMNLADFFRHFELGDRFSYSLDVLSRTMCPRFHIDYYQLRLIVTYVGEATQWTANSNVLLTGDEHAMLPIEIADMDLYYNLNPLDVTLLQGSSFAMDQQGVAHRSPDSYDQTRVLLRFEF